MNYPSLNMSSYLNGSLLLAGLIAIGALSCIAYLIIKGKL